MIIDKDQLTTDLSNFYKNYGNDSGSIDFLFSLFEDIALLIEEYLYSVKRNQVISSMEAYRRFHFAAFEGHQACYNILELLSLDSNASYIGLSGDISGRVASWNNTVTRENKIKLLNRTGKYIGLSAKRESDVSEPEIVDLTLKNIHRTELVKNVDYILENNRIYLLGKLATETVSNSRLIATNVFVDYDFPYNLLGERIGIPYSSEITKPEYRDFIQMVAYVLVKGPTLKNLKDSFNTLAGWEGSNIVDMISAKGARQDMWLNPDTAILTPFDFLVTIPASAASTVGYTDGVLGPKDERLGIFSSFLDVVKPTDTAYILALSELITEDEDPNDQLANIISMPTEDSSTASDDFSNKISINIEETFSQGHIIRSISYDSGENYDELGAYDRDSLSEVGADKYGDLLSVNLITYPEYPVSFVATKNILTGNANISFSDSAPDVVEYEVVRNGSVVYTVSATGDKTTKTWTDTELPGLGSGTYTYYAQSVYYVGDEKFTSRPSKKSVIIK